MCQRVVASKRFPNVIAVLELCDLAEVEIFVTFYRFTTEVNDLNINGARCHYYEYKLTQTTVALSNVET